MKQLRLFVAIIVCFLICYSADLTDYLYSAAASKNIKKLGKLNEFQADCSDLIGKYKFDCSLLYRIPIGKIITDRTEGSEILELGVGVISGSTEWFCSSGNKLVKIFENNSSSSSIFREGLMLYSTATIPTHLCGETLLIKVIADSRNFVTKTGWKSGSLVIGPTTIVRSYKNIIDFFSSYLRILLAFLSVLLLSVSKSADFESISGYKEYRRAIYFLSIHFLASSSLFDVLMPNGYGLGFIILMAGGTTGCIHLILSAAKSLNIFGSNNSFKKSTSLGHSGLFGFALFVSFGTYYFFATGKYYLSIQAILAVTLFGISLVARAPSYIIFSALFISNVLAGYGVLPGYPTNTATHFLLILFIIDSFEEVALSNALFYLLNGAREKVPVIELTALLARRFSLKRTSTSMFTRDYEFVTKRLFLNREVVLAVERKVSKLAAHVMTSRRPLLRIRVGSEESRILKGPDFVENRSRGKEFCIFPLVLSERMLGTLNISGYPVWVLADPSQMFLFNSMLQKILPRLAEIRYREDLSPNIEDQHSIREIETTFLSLIDRSKDKFLNAMNSITKNIDAKLIISKANPMMDMFETFSNHHYGESESVFLESHTPKLSSTLLASPANIAYHHKTTVFINNLENMLSIYPDFLVKLLKANSTKSLFVKPVYSTDKGTPWGVVWLEFNNRISRSEVDLRELAEFAVSSIERMLVSYFEFNVHQNVLNKTSNTLPIHVMEKIKKGIDPREEEQGYLFNIDLAGSTKLSKMLGPLKFSEFINRVNEGFTKILSNYQFVPQIIIWDSFAFTRTSTVDCHILQATAREILNAVDAYIATLNQTLDDECQISFRAVLNYGDITRDWSVGQAKYWTIVGSAYAESCKLESELKPQKRVLLMADNCPGNTAGQTIVNVNSEKAAA